MDSRRSRAVQHLIAFIIASGLALLIFHAVDILRDKTVPVLTTARDVGESMRITADDLTTVDLVPTPGTRVLFARDRPSTLGQYAAATLPKGTILTKDDLTSRAMPEQSQIVGLRVDRAQRPAQRLRLGALICVSPLPEGKPCDDKGALAGSFLARVAGSSNADTGGTAMVDVVVGRALAETALAAASRSVLISLIGD